ncbi:MAG: hypothetical protein IPP91_00250 [Betaproteobacteria bacterium]|nr:hypothetical protein [Betaproteobacteria bacterium]
MEDDRDILGKADALLRRHVPPRAEDGDSADFPVLTEVITRGGTPAAGPAAPAAPPAQVHDRTMAAGDDEYTRALIAEVVNAVQSRLARDLERRLTQQVAAEVHASVAATLGDLRQEIANAVGDAVAEALARRPHR